MYGIIYSEKDFPHFTAVIMIIIIITINIWRTFTRAFVSPPPASSDRGRAHNVTYINPLPHRRRLPSTIIPIVETS